MQGWLGPDSYVGFCGNCRPVRGWADVHDLLANFAPAVQRGLGGREAVGVGLWLPAQLVNLRRAIAADDVPALEAARAAATAGAGGKVFTFNGFPYGDFQSERVKHDVYWPDWTTVERAAYTADLVRCAAEFAPRLKQVSISTLPVGWRDSVAAGDAEKSGRLLRTTAEVLREHHERTGQLVHLDLEPEPGCLLETSDDVVHFFETYLLDRRTEHVVRRYLRVCHDVCHAAVMGEPQEQAFRNYAASGIEVGKVQISSALEADFENRSAAERAALLSELRQFAEPRFLHQTVLHGAAATDSAHATRRKSSASHQGSLAFFEDLPQALAAAGETPTGRWRVHFHVPIHLERIGRLHTTQHEIAEALRAARLFSKCRHFEVETYAWSVLPEDLREADMAVGVAKELRWLRELIQRENLAGLADD